ncbi:MAG: putative Ig domain-containing protein [Planctomycetota bacterium]
MRLVIATSLALLCLGAPAATPGGSSTPYAIVTDTIDAGGGTAGSTNYTNLGSLGGIEGVSSVSTYGARHGYIAQLGGAVITSSETADGAVGQNFSYQITTNSTASSYSAISLPPGLSINTTSGLISGTPTQAGSYNVPIGAQTSDGAASAKLTITISSSAPVITSSLSVNAVVGQPFSYTITAQGGTPITFGAAPLPLWLSQANATLAGTPTATGTLSITISASNAGGSDQKTLTVKINPDNSPLITSPMTAAGAVGTSFSYQITASGSAPLTFLAAPLPPGLSFSGDSITGTPTTVGETQVTLQASNSIGQDSKVLTISISAAGAPQITSALSQQGRVGTVLIYTITANGRTPITFSCGILPGGLALDSGTGQILGTPTESGNFQVAISASNAIGSDSKVLELDIRTQDAISPAVTAINLSRNPARTNTNVTFTATALATPGAALAYSWAFFSNDGTQDGPDQSGNAVTRQFTTEGTYYAVVRAFDGFETSQEFKQLNVLPLAPNAGGAGPNSTNGTALSNPVDGTTVAVSDSLAGVLSYDLSSVAASREGETFQFSLPGRGINMSGPMTGDKYTASGLYVLTVTRFDATGTASGKMRRTIPVSNRETGEASSVTPPASLALSNTKVSGKFVFQTGKSDKVQMSCALKMPGGVNMNGTFPVAVGLGNVVQTVAVTKGKGAKIGAVTAFTISAAKLPKNKTTKGGEDAKVSLTLLKAGLSAAGFDTEGIINTKIDKKTPANRQIQVAFVIEGVSYYGTLQAQYTNAKNVGTLATRRGQ